MVLMKIVGSDGYTVVRCFDNGCEAYNFTLIATCEYPWATEVSIAKDWDGEKHMDELDWIIV